MMGCASVQAPPGGPPDSAPPVLLTVTPDSGAVAEGLKDPVTFRFDEVIDERSGGGLDKLVLLSPVPDRMEIHWRRQALTVRPGDGWRTETTYHVTLLPGVADLRGNRLATGTTLVFTTGGPVPNATLAGTVVDWEAGRLTPRALVRAVLLPDSLVYLAAADSGGDFRLGALPPGRYHVAAIADANSNRRQDGREAFDSMTVQLDSLVEQVFWTFRQDTVGPSLSRVTLADSQTVRLEFSQALALGAPEPASVQVLALPDSQPLTVTAVWTQVQFDSIRASRPRAATGDSLAPDTLAAEPPVAPPPERPPPPAGVAGPPSGVAPGERAPPTTAPDTGRVARIIGQRPRPGAALVIELESPLAPGARYVVTADVANLVGARQRSRTLLVVPEPAAAAPR